MIQRYLEADLTPFEVRVLSLLCDGLTNQAIAHEVDGTTKVVLNAIYRAGKKFGIRETPDINSRVTLAMAFTNWSQQNSSSLVA